MLFVVSCMPLQGFVPEARAQDGPTNGAPIAATPSNVQSGNQPAKDAFSSCTNSAELSICLTNIVYVFTVGIMGILAYIGSYVFNIAIQITLQSVTYSQQFLTDGWAAIRDLANMTFIFMLVYLAITIVLGAETTGSMKMLVSIIAMALLINFSFFGVRVVIDAGNILAVQFYNAIDAPAIAESSGYIGRAATAVSPNGGIRDLTANIMKVVGVETLLGSGSFSKAFQQKNSFITNVVTFILIYLAVGAILAVLAFSFLYVGFNFLVRVVMLWFAIIASPLALVAWAMSQTKNASKLRGFFDWWSGTLVQFAFYPAVFLFLFLIINLFAKSLGGSNLLEGAFASVGGVTSAGLNLGAALLAIASVIGAMLIRLGLVVVLLWGAVKLSDKMSKGAGGYAGGASSWVKGKTVGMLKNSGNFAYRNTVARKAQSWSGKLSNSKTFNTGPLGWVGYKVRKGVLDPMADKSFNKGRSLLQVQKDTKTRLAELKKDLSANLSNIESKQATKDLAQLSSAHNSVKLKALEARKKDTADFEKTQTIEKAFVSDPAKAKLLRRYDNEEERERIREWTGYLAAKLRASGTLSKFDQDTIKEMDARKTALDAEINSAGLLSAAEKVELTSVINAREKLKTLNPLTPREAGELTRLDAERQKISSLNTKVNGFSQAEFNSAFASKSDVESVLAYLKESSIKRVGESGLSNKDKADLFKQWHEKAADAPQQKAHKEIGVLEDIRDTLKKQSGNTILLKSIEENLASGKLVTASSVDEVLREVQSVEVAEKAQRSSVRDASAKQLAGNNLLEIGKAIKALGKLKEDLEKIPAEVGGSQKPGEFKRK